MATFIIIVLLWVLLGFVLYRIQRRRAYPLTQSQVLVFLGGKIAAGAAYGYIFQRWYNGDDTWGLHRDSLLQYQRLLHRPGLFFADVFSRTPVPPGEGFYFQSAHYDENLEYCITGKFLGILNCISGGQYYINVVLLNFFGFLGIYLIYRLLAPYIRDGAQGRIAALLFLFPPLTFWLSGIRTECFLLIAVGAMYYCFGRWLHTNAIKYLVIAGVAGIIAFIFRSGFVAVQLPSLLAWLMVVRFRWTIHKSLQYVAAGCAGLLLVASFLPVRFNPLNKIAERQQSFFQLKGNTRFDLTPLEPTPVSFIRVMPEAIANTILRPYPWEARGALQFFSAAENLFVWVLLVTAVLFYQRSKEAVTGTTLVAVLLAGAAMGYLLIGYIVPFPGAIVRYRVIAELWVLSAAGLLLWGKAQRTTASSQI